MSHSLITTLLKSSPADWSQQFHNDLVAIQEVVADFKSRYSPQRPSNNDVAIALINSCEEIAQIMAATAIALLGVEAEEDENVILTEAVGEFERVKRGLEQLHWASMEEVGMRQDRERNKVREERPREERHKEERHRKSRHREERHREEGRDRQAHRKRGERSERRGRDSPSRRHHRRSRERSRERRHEQRGDDKNRREHRPPTADADGVSMMSTGTNFGRLVDRFNSGFRGMGSKQDNGDYNRSDPREKHRQTIPELDSRSVEELDSRPVYRKRTERDRDLYY